MQIAHLAEEDMNFELMTRTDEDADLVDDSEIDVFGDPLNLLLAYEEAGYAVMKNEPRSISAPRRVKTKL